MANKTSFKTCVDGQKAQYEITMNTDSKENFDLVLYLVRSLMDGKQCGVTVTDALDAGVAYIN